MLKPALSCPCPLPPPHPLALSFCMLAIPAWKFLNTPCYVTPCVWHMLFPNLVELVISCITSWWICVFWRFFFCEVCVQVFRSFFYWDVFCFLINSQAFLYVQHTSSTHCKYFFFLLMACVFTIFMVSLDGQKLLTLVWPNLSSFYFILCTSLLLKKYLFILRSWIYSPILSSKTFIILLFKNRFFFFWWNLSMTR